MKSYMLVLIALATVLLCTEYVNAIEICPQENCITPDKCQILTTIRNDVCPQQDTSCCSVVKEEFRTHCRHHGGECMNSCADTLTRSTVDCKNNQVCCILV